MKDLDNPTVGPVHLQLFRPSVIRGPWFKQRDLNVLEGTLKMKSSQPSHRFDDFTT